MGTVSPPQRLHCPYGPPPPFPPPPIPPPACHHRPGLVVNSIPGAWKHPLHCVPPTLDKNLPVIAEEENDSDRVLELAWRKFQAERLLRNWMYMNAVGAGVRVRYWMTKAGAHTHDNMHVITPALVRLFELSLQGQFDAELLGCAVRGDPILHLL